MRIDHLHLENFCGLESLKLDLHPRCTVLAGVNGAGKTSVLKGLSVALGAWFLGFDSIAPRKIEADDVRVLPQRHGELVNLEPQYPVRISAEGEVLGEGLSWSRERLGKGNNTTSPGAGTLKSLSNLTQSKVRRGDPVDLPVIASYGTGRLWVQKRASTRKDDALGSRTLAYEDCLDPASSHKLFEAWMRRQEQARIQRIAEALGAGGPLPPEVNRPPALTAVQRAAVACLPGAEQLFNDVALEELRVVLAEGEVRPFRLLSDGYRDLVAIAADIAWRAVQLNPHHGASAPQEAVGVVLIDEVELHLHPAWQRRVLEQLLAAFPRLQFIVTTHSPQVLSSRPADEVRFLDAQGQVHRVDVALGLDTNTVLRDLMGVAERPEDITLRLAALADAIEGGNFDQAQTELEDLGRLLGDDDPNLTAMAWELAGARAAVEEP